MYKIEQIIDVKDLTSKLEAIIENGIIPITLIEYCYVSACLKKNRGIRTTTARDLRRSLRWLRYIIREIDACGIDVPPPGGIAGKEIDKEVILKNENSIVVMEKRVFHQGRRWPPKKKRKKRKND